MNTAHALASVRKSTRTKKSRKPLAEGIVKRKKRPHGFFSKMSDDEVVRYAKKMMRLSI